MSEISLSCKTKCSGRVWEVGAVALLEKLIWLEQSVPDDRDGSGILGAESAVCYNILGCSDAAETLLSFFSLQSHWGGFVLLVRLSCKRPINFLPQSGLKVYFIVVFWPNTLDGTLNKSHKCWDPTQHWSEGAEGHSCSTYWNVAHKEPKQRLISLCDNTDLKLHDAFISARLWPNASSRQMNLSLLVSYSHPKASALWLIDLLSGFPPLSGLKHWGSSQHDSYFWLGSNSQLYRSGWRSVLSSDRVDSYKNCRICNEKERTLSHWNVSSLRLSFGTCDLIVNSSQYAESINRMSSSDAVLPCDMSCKIPIS